MGKYKDFHDACGAGDLERAKKLYNKTYLKSTKRKMLETDDYQNFRLACCRMQLGVAQWLYESASDEQKPAMLQAGNHDSFRWACANEQLEMAQWLYKSASEEQKSAMLQAGDYESFRKACAKEQVELAQWLYESASDKQKPDMLQAENYASFRKACAMGRLEQAQWLYESTSDEQKPAMLQAGNYEGFHLACQDWKLEVMDWLAPKLSASSDKIDWQWYNRHAMRAKIDFEGKGCTLPLPELSQDYGDVPSVETRHFIAIAHKLLLLKEAFEGISLETMLGDIKKPKKNMKWNVPWAKINEEAQHVTHDDVGGVVDTVKEVSRYIAGYMLKTKHDDAELQSWSEGELEKHAAPLEQDIAKHMLEGHTLKQLQAISKLWHERRHGVLSGNEEVGRQGLRDFAQGGAWHPLLVDGVELACDKEGLENYRVANLTNSAELDEEGGEMGHCVNSYVTSCQQHNFQIFSIQKRDSEGNWCRATTLGCDVAKGKLLPPRSGNHQGKSNRKANSEEQAVADWLIDGVNKGDINAQFNRLGEIPTEDALSAFEDRIGVKLADLTPMRIETNFQNLAKLNHKGTYLLGKSMRNATFDEFANAVREHGSAAAANPSAPTEVDAADTAAADSNKKNNKAYDKLVQDYYNTNFPDQAPDVLRHIHAGLQEFKVQMPDAQIQTMASNSGETMLRFAEDDTHLYLLGIVTRSGTVPPEDTQDVLNMRTQLMNKLKQGKVLMTSANETSNQLIDRMIKLLKKEDPNIKIQDQKHPPRHIDGVGGWTNRIVSVNNSQAQQASAEQHR